MTKDTRRRFGRESWVVGIITFVLLLCVDIATSYPAFPSTLHLKIKFPKGIVGRSEPLVATGHIPHGDFLLVTYYSPNTLVLIHDSWGRAVTSPPITFQPDVSYALDLEMPAIANAGQPSPKQTDQLRVNVAGIDLIRQEVPFYPSARRRVFFAENPVGSTTVGVLFTGQITTIDGKILRGRPGELFSMTARMGAWVSNRWWHVVPFLLLAGSVTWAVDRAKRRRDASGQNNSGVVVMWAKTHGWFVMAAVLNGIVFLWLMSGGQFRLIYPDAFGAFYDSQAISLLQGHLDVPEWVLASEAFAVNGKYYGYFGLTPALLRLPFMLAGELGFGHMTRAWMLVDYLASLAGAYVILCYVTRLIRGKGARPSGWAVGLLMLATGMGSTLLFLASRAYIYHEAILCGVAFAIWSTYCSLRYLEAPRSRWWIGALVAGTLSVQARPPTGLFALGLLGCVAAAHLFAERRNLKMWRRPVMVGILAMAGFFTLQAVAYLKFGTTDGAPLRYHVQYDPQRLAKIEGKNFHLANLHHNVDAYLLWPAFEAGRRFPYFIFDLKKREYPGAKMDLEERVVGILYSMCGLVVLAIAGAVGATRLKTLRRPVLLISAASVPLVGCMLTFIGTSHRYTADFCPPLIAAAVFGVVFLDQLPRSPRAILMAVATVAAVFSFMLTLGLAFHFQVDLVWGVPEEVRANYLKVRACFDQWFGVT